MINQQHPKIECLGKRELPSDLDEAARSPSPLARALSSGLGHQGEQSEALNLGTTFKGVLNSVIRTNNTLVQYFGKKMTFMQKIHNKQTIKI